MASGCQSQCQWIITIAQLLGVGGDGEGVGPDGEGPVEAPVQQLPLQDQRLHPFLDLLEPPLELDAVAAREPELQQQLLVHLDEGGLEHEEAAAPVRGGHRHDPRGDHLRDGHPQLHRLLHLGGVALLLEAGDELPLGGLLVGGHPEPGEPAHQPLELRLVGLGGGDSLGGSRGAEVILVELTWEDIIMSSILAGWVNP